MRMWQAPGPARALGEAGGLTLSPSPERRKPPPPDPATEPTVSWIHGKQGAATAAPSPPAGRMAAPSPSGRKRTPSNTSVQPPGLTEEVPAPAAPSPPRARARGRGPGLWEPTDADGAPRSAPGAASMLAAELRDKTRSLGRAEGPPGPREKPPPPQKAKCSVLPTSTARASVASEATAPEKAAAGTPAPKTPWKKTPIQKPPRKKSREVAGELSRAARHPQLPRLTALQSHRISQRLFPRGRSETFHWPKHKAPGTRLSDWPRLQQPQLGWICSQAWSTFSLLHAPPSSVVEIF